MALMLFDLSSARQQARLRMCDTARITREGTTPVFNESTGRTTYEEEVVYEGQAKVQSTAQPTTAEFGGKEVTYWTATVHVPMEVTTVRTGDVIEITEATWDEALVGQHFIVRSILTKSMATSRRLMVEVKP